MLTVHRFSFLVLCRGVHGVALARRGSRPSCLVAAASLLFPRTPARITTFKCVERCIYVRLRETKNRRKKRRREFTRVGTVRYGGRRTLARSSSPVILNLLDPWRIQ